MLRLDADAKPFVLLDSPFQEIHVLRFDDKGALYVGALSGRPSGGATPVTGMTEGNDQPSTSSDRAPVASVSVSTEITAIVVDSSGSSASPARDDQRGVKGAVYRINPDGVWDQLWESREDSPYDLTFDQTARSSSGPATRARCTGSKAIRFARRCWRAPARNRSPPSTRDRRGRLYYATANPGKVFRLTPERATRGTYESEPRDAQMVATWGALSWRGTASGGNRIELFTRSGNTATPDETWSAWSAASTNAEGSPITSPKTRYLQWRAVLTGKGDGPVLTSVTAAYLQRNLRPQVRSVTVHPPGIVFQKPYTTGEPDLAGFEDQTTPERKLAQAAALQGRLERAGPPRLSEGARDAAVARRRRE